MSEVSPERLAGSGDPLGNFKPIWPKERLLTIPDEHLDQAEGSFRGQEGSRVGRVEGNETRGGS